MTIRHKAFWTIAGPAIAIALAPAALHAQAAPVPEGFTALFDGKTLNGWHGNTKVWRVEDGAITGGTESPIDANTFLIYERPYGDFEVRFKYRWQTPEGNSGFQFRSGQMEGDYVLTGLQANVTPIDVPPDRYGMLYNETGDRQEMVMLGQRAEITRRSANGMGTGRVVRTVKEMVNDRAAILKTIKPYPEWNEVVLIAYGNHMVSAINGMLAFDALDNDPVGKRDGLFGLQAHKGPVMKVQFKDIVVKPLTAAPDLEGRFKSTVSPAPEPRQTYKDSTRAAMPDVALPQ